MAPLIWSLTHPCPREWLERFEDTGITITHIPFVRIEPVSDTSEVDSALKGLSSYDGVVFTSQHSVRMTADRLRLLGLTQSVLIYAVGSSTAREVEAQGWFPERAPLERSRVGNRPFSAHGLAVWLGENLGSGRLLFLKSAASRMEPWRRLEKNGIEVDGVDLYRPSPITHRDGTQVRDVIGNGGAWVVFGSPSGVRGWINIWGSTRKATAMLDPSKVCALGKTTAKALDRIGIRAAVIPRKPTVEYLCRAIFRRVGSERHEPVG